MTATVIIMTMMRETQRESETETQRDTETERQRRRHTERGGRECVVRGRERERDAWFVSGQQL